MNACASVPSQPGHVGRRTGGACGTDFAVSGIPIPETAKL